MFQRKSELSDCGAAQRVCRQQGFTYLWVLFAVAILGVWLASAGVVWHFAQQREKERELLFVGSEYRDAIAQYYNHGPGGARQYPNELSDLLKDPRYLSTQRYLRRIYRDPMTWKSEWGLVKSSSGGIMGVYSLSSDKPIKTKNFRDIDQSFEGKTSYRDWKFVNSTLPTSGGASGTTSGSTGPAAGTPPRSTP